jgi:hypothetical protein
MPSYSSIFCPLYSLLPHRSSFISLLYPNYSLAGPTRQPHPSTYPLPPRRSFRLSPGSSSPVLIPLSSLPRSTTLLPLPLPDFWPAELTRRRGGGGVGLDGGGGGHGDPHPRELELPEDRPVLCRGGRRRGAHAGELGEEAQRPARCAPRHTADEADAREVELHDRGVGHIAPDAGPGAGRHGRVPTQRVLVRHVSVGRAGPSVSGALRLGAVRRAELRREA